MRRKKAPQQWHCGWQDTTEPLHVLSRGGTAWQDVTWGLGHRLVALPCGTTTLPELTLTCVECCPTGAAACYQAPARSKVCSKERVLTLRDEGD